MCNWDQEDSIELRTSPEYRTDGMIMSPGYPFLHSERHACTCELQTYDDATITFTLLDFHLEESDNCEYDFLEFNNADIEGKRICGDRNAGETVTLKGSVELFFLTDEVLEERGFWLYYHGKNISQA